MPRWKHSTLWYSKSTLSYSKSSLCYFKSTLWYSKLTLGTWMSRSAVIWCKYVKFLEEIANLIQKYQNPTGIRDVEVGKYTTLWYSKWNLWYSQSTLWCSKSTLGTWMSKSAGIWCKYVKILEEIAHLVQK